MVFIYTSIHGTCVYGFILVKVGLSYFVVLMFWRTPIARDQSDTEDLSVMTEWESDEGAPEQIIDLPLYWKTEKASVVRIAGSSA